jgi:hypothetical protein
MLSLAQQPCNGSSTKTRQIKQIVQALEKHEGPPKKKPKQKRRRKNSA